MTRYTQLLRTEDRIEARKAEEAVKKASHIKQELKHLKGIMELWNKQK